MASSSQSRGSSPKSPSGRRPKLMRASATAPSLATSNASRNDLASLQSARAATLLTRVASYSTAQQNYEREHRQSIGSVCSSGQGSPASPERKEPFEIVIQQCEFSSLLSIFCFLLRTIQRARNEWMNEADHSYSGQLLQLPQL